MIFCFSIGSFVGKVIYLIVFKAYWHKVKKSFRKLSQDITKWKHKELFVITRVLWKANYENKWLYILEMEMSKTLNWLNPDFMKNILHYSCHSYHEKNNVQVQNRNRTRHAKKSLHILEANILIIYNISSRVHSFIDTHNYLTFECFDIERGRRLCLRAN